MKHAKKKKRARPSKQANKPDVVANGGDGEVGQVMSGLIAGAASISIEEKGLGNGEVNEELKKGDDQVATCSVSSGSGSLWACSSSCSGDFMVSDNYRIGEKITKSSSRSKKVVATTGMVSSVLGKEYVSCNRRKGVAKWKEWDSDALVSNADAEQFLCSMLSDECELGMAVVKDVLCQSGYDVQKALDVLLELTGSSCEPSQNGQYFNFNAYNREDDQYLGEANDSNYEYGRKYQGEESPWNYEIFCLTLTDRASDSTSHSSESDFQENMWSMGCKGRNYADALTGSGAHSSSGHISSFEIPQEILESLFNTPKSSKHEPSTMNWRNVVKKIESFGQTLELYPSNDAGSKQLAPGKGDDYQVLRNNAREHWDSMKSYYQKAAMAYANGKREYAGYLSEQGRICNTMARQADKKAGHDIFHSRNKRFENVITIDLHGQHVKQAMRLLKLHLLFGAYVRSVRLFRVITGCGNHGMGKSKLKHSVVNLIEREGIEWSEENRGTLLIRLDEGQREFSFLDSDSDTE